MYWCSAIQLIQTIYQSSLTVGLEDFQQSLKSTAMSRHLNLGHGPNRLVETYQSLYFQLASQAETLVFSTAALASEFEHLGTHCEIVPSQLWQTFKASKSSTGKSKSGNEMIRIGWEALAVNEKIFSMHCLRLNASLKIIQM